MSIKNIKINTEVTLSVVEQAIVKGVAKQRFNNNRANGVYNAKIGDQSNYDTDIEGFGAELAFCRLHNLYPDFSISPRSTNEDQGDAILPIPNGIVDVKGTKYPTGKLITPTWKSKDAVDVYALMVGEFPNYIFKGFMKSSDLMVSGRIGDMGYGKKSFIASQDELIDLIGLYAS
jgi:hypothetical protein